MRVKIFGYIFIIILALVAAVRPFELGTDFDSYRLNYSTGELVSEPLYNLIVSCLKYFISFEIFVFLLVFISLSIFFRGILKYTKSGIQVFFLFFLLVLSYYPIFFLGHLRSGLSSSIIVYVLINKPTSRRVFFYGCFAGLIHFAAIIFCFYPIFKFLVIKLSYSSKSRYFTILFILIIGILIFFSNVSIENVINIMPGNVLEDKWRVFGSLQGTLEDDFETRKLTIFNSPRFIYWLLILFIFWHERRLFIVDDKLILNFKLVLCFAATIFLLTSSVAMVAFKSSYIYLPCTVWLLYYYYGRKNYIKVMLFMCFLFYDILSFSLPRFIN